MHLRCWCLRLPYMNAIAEETLELLWLPYMSALRMSVPTEQTRRMDAWWKHLHCWRVWLVYMSALWRKRAVNRFCDIKRV